jgi:predicted enzyme related to lactoylglutathione lyase
VSVADCDATLARALSLRATRLLAPMDMEQVGRFCVIEDPLGAPVGLIKAAPRMQ